MATQFTPDERQALLIVESLIKLDKPIAPVPDRLLELGLVWRDTTGKVRMTVAGLVAAKAARLVADGILPAR